MTVDCSKPSTLSYAYWNIPPLVDIDPFVDESVNNASGVMIRSLQRLLTVCCHPDTKLVAKRRACNPRDLEESIGDETFIFPVRKSLLRFQTYYPSSEQFIPVLESPGSGLNCCLIYLC